MNKKILVSDYDQTFYLNDEDLEKNKIAVNSFRAKGNLFVFATGRSFYDFHRKIDKYNIKFDYAILNHGATIIDKDDNVFVNFPMPNEIIKDLKKDLRLEKRQKGFCCKRLESRVDFRFKDLTKINVTYTSKEEAISVNNIINKKYKKYVNCYYIMGSSLEIISNKTSKSNAIKILLEKLKLPKESVYTIGDGYSDIDMVKDFNGYAINDSIDELKKVAKKEYNSVSKLISDII